MKDVIQIWWLSNKGLLWWSFPLFWLWSVCNCKDKNHKGVQNYFELAIFLRILKDKDYNFFFFFFFYVDSPWWTVSFRPSKVNILISITMLNIKIVRWLHQLKKVDSNLLLFLEEIANSIEFFHSILQHHKRKMISFARVRTHDLPHPLSKLTT